MGIGQLISRLFVLCSVITVNASALNINLNTGLLNDKSFESLTVSSVTDLLGKPDKSFRPVDSTHGTAGVVLAYERLGLRLAFDDSENDPKRLRGMCVWLEPATEDFSLIDGGRLNFAAYAGKLTSNINGNWKYQKFLEAFAGHGAIDKTEEVTAAKMRSQLAEYEKIAFESGDKQEVANIRNTKKSLYLFFRAEMPIRNWLVVVFYDETTKFLTKIEVIQNTTNRCRRQGI
ncbi:MAG: hypothetical protein WCH84_06130 [Verrucomicrobiota bacterium]